ncbi:MAG: hypothetical protein V1897_03670 [Pseudomonadota bacterium]
MNLTNIPQDIDSQRLLALLVNLQRILNEAAHGNCPGTEVFSIATVEYMGRIHDELSRRSDQKLVFRNDSRLN